MRLANPSSSFFPRSSAPTPSDPAVEGARATPVMNCRLNVDWPACLNNTNVMMPMMIRCDEALMQVQTFIYSLSHCLHLN